MARGAIQWGMETLDEQRRLEAWMLFLQVHTRLLQRLEGELEAESRLPLTWYDVLVQLSAAPGQRLRMSDLFHALLLSKSGLTRRIDRMEASGLVSREGCPGDRRGVYAVLTPAGREALVAAAPIHLRGIQEHFGRHLTDIEIVVLREALQKILGNLGDVPGAACAESLDVSA